MNYLAQQALGGAPPPQQDRLLVVTFPDGSMGWALADGLSGAPRGDLAAVSALSVIEDAWRRGPNLTVELVRAAHEYVQLLARATTGAQGMAAALTVVLFRPEGRVRWIHVGSNRLYVLRDGRRLVRLTRDHTLAGQALERGHLTPEVAEIHPDRFVLYQAVGGPDEPVPDTGEAEARPGDLWLLLSDGVVDGLGDAGLMELIARSETTGDLAEALLARAEREQSGNATVLATVIPWSM